MRDMAHSICLIKLYQIRMRKKFRFFASDYLKQFVHVSNGKGGHFKMAGCSEVTHDHPVPEHGF